MADDPKPFPGEVRVGQIWQVMMRAGMQRFIICGVSPYAERKVATIWENTRRPARPWGGWTVKRLQTGYKGVQYVSESSYAQRKPAAEREPVRLPPRTYMPRGVKPERVREDVHRLARAGMPAAQISDELGLRREVVEQLMPASLRARKGAA